MDNTPLLHVSRSDQPPWRNQNRYFTGAGASFLIHAIALCCIIYASSALSNFSPPLVIDFSIEKYDGDIVAQKGIAKVVLQENPPVPQIKPAPPVHQPLPKKTEVIIPEKIEPIVTEKVEAEKEEPKQVEIVPVEEQPVEQTFPEPIISSVEPVVDNRSTFAENNDPAPSVVPIVTPSPSRQKEQYKKEHFDYIEERVKSRITYPRIARKMGWQGRVIVSFVICRDGSVKNIRIVESSGFKALDNNAIKVIRKVAPFPKPPVAAELTIPVTYKLS